MICSLGLTLLIVYRVGRLCGGAHEISGIKALLFLHGWVGCGGVGVVVVGWVWVVGWGGGGVGWWWGWVGVGRWCGVWCAGEGCCGWWMKGG